MLTGQVNFDWQAVNSVGSDSCVEVGVDVKRLLRRHGTSSQAALQRLATYLMAPDSVPSLDKSARESEGNAGEEEDEPIEEHWAMASTPKASGELSHLRFSPPGIINLDSESRDVAGIPQDAFCFCMNHGLVPPEGQQRKPADEVVRNCVLLCCVHPEVLKTV